MLRRSFGARRDKLIGEWRKLHTEELNDQYCSPNIVRVIKPRRMKWVVYVAHMGERRGIYRVLVEKPGGKRPIGRLRYRGRIILRWIFRKYDVGVWTGLSWHRIGTGIGHL